MGESERRKDHLSGDRGTEEDFEIFLERIPGGVFKYRADEPDTFEFVSKGMLDLMGCKTREEFDEVTKGCFKYMVHPDDRQATLDSIEEQISQQDTDVVVYRLNRPDGKEVWVDDHGRIVIDPDGQRWFYVTALDITSKMESEKELTRSHERMVVLTALSNDIVFDIDCESGHAEVYGDFEERFHRSPVQSDFVVRRRCHKDCKLDIHTKSVSQLMGRMGDDSLMDFESSTEGPDGQPIYYRYQSVVLYDDNGHPVRHIGRLLDDHDLKMSESQFRRKAEHDALTGLFNRGAALNRIEPILRESGTPFTFFLIDVDDFKSVNDTYGHPEGDKVLIDLANFIGTVMRQEDILVRLGGDEFAVFAKGLKPGPAFDRITKKLVRGYQTDETVQGSLAKPSISLGVVYGDGTPITFDEIYSQADDALYEAKKKGKGQAEVRQVQ